MRLWVLALTGARHLSAVLSCPSLLFSVATRSRASKYIYAKCLNLMPFLCKLATGVSLQYADGSPSKTALSTNFLFCTSRRNRTFGRYDRYSRGPGFDPRMRHLEKQNTETRQKDVSRGTLNEKNQRLITLTLHPIAAAQVEAVLAPLTGKHSHA